MDMSLCMEFTDAHTHLQTGTDTDAQILNPETAFQFS